MTSFPADSIITLVPRAQNLFFPCINPRVIGVRKIKKIRKPFKNNKGYGILRISLKKIEAREYKTNKMLETIIAFFVERLKIFFNFSGFFSLEVYFVIIN